MAFDWIKWYSIQDSLFSDVASRFFDDNAEEVPLDDFIRENDLIDEVDSKSYDEAFAAHNEIPSVKFRFTNEYAENIRIFFDIDTDYESEYIPDSDVEDQMDKITDNYRLMREHERYKALEHFDTQEFHDEVLGFQQEMRIHGIEKACGMFEPKFEILNYVKQLPKVIEFYEMKHGKNDKESVNEDVCRLYEAMFAVMYAKINLKYSLVKWALLTLEHKCYTVPEDGRDLNWKNRNYNISLLPISRIYDIIAQLNKRFKEEGSVLGLATEALIQPAFLDEHLVNLIDGYSHDIREELLRITIDSNLNTIERRFETILSLIKSCVRIDNPRLFEKILMAQLSPHERMNIKPKYDIRY
jgi:hypothetical protein